MKEKQFSLKTSEVTFIKNLQDTHYANISMFLSMISTDRLAYDVTEKTRYRMEGNTLFISEVEDKPDEEVAVS